MSKAIWEPLERVSLGGAIPIDRYTSKHAAFSQLGKGDSLFLVTIRPYGPMLVAIIDEPQRKGAALVGRPNRTPPTVIDKQLRALVLADGKGITAPLDKLGMSLQTPRVLAAQDVELLRGVAPVTGEATSSRVVKMKVPAKARTSSTPATSPKLRFGPFSKRAKALVAQIYKDPDDGALRAVLADQLLQDQHILGELMSLQLVSSKRNAPRIAQIVRRHARDLVGDIANVAKRDSMTIVDGFLHTVQCDRSKHFTSAEERHTAAIAREWATVRTVRLTTMMTAPFIKELLHNRASANLTMIEDAWNGIQPRLVRATPEEPWQIVHPRCGRVLDGLPASELARIPMPATQPLRDALEAARARRAKAAGKTSSRVKRARGSAGARRVRGNRPRSR